ncbi:MAG: DUF4177 domain-containing protein [Clostridium sp.]|nr:DUF4177 domain-containing protein [Clostridium sp.]
MGKYNYKFVEVPFDGDLKTDETEIFQKCKEIITTESARGWRLIQILTPESAKKCPGAKVCYEIVLEQEISAEKEA